ncbi:DUF4396 domain-containing protein [Bacillus sp. 1P06AnD]|uniref:DUF4396 domain-containing protein n=1 Tax=Bacillus sp. 1P06AnD TaxID=3132208 RepID=UPI0039A0A4C6
MTVIECGSGYKKERTCLRASNHHYAFFLSSGVNGRELHKLFREEEMDTLTVVSYIAVFLGIISAVFIAVDLVSHPQSMKIMNIVWPINGLYLGPFAIWAYWVMGREKGDDGEDMDMGGKKPFWQSVFVSTSHCSGGCTLGDAFGVPFVFFTGFTIMGSMLFTHYVVEFILAYIFGVLFQVFSIVPMNRQMGNHMSWGKGFIEAIKADTISLIAFEIGMFGWMAIVHYVLFDTPPEPNSMPYWFMMQIAMILGALTSYPANWFLVKKGIKEGM